MSRTLCVEGIKPPDGDWLKMKAVYDSCKEAKIDIPREVRNFFGEMPPDEKGVIVELPTHEYEGDFRSGYEINLREISSDVKIIRFYIC